MKAYCITLDPNDPNRARRAIREIKKLGFDCEFAEGVDLRSFTLDQLKTLLTPRAYVELLQGRQVHEALSGLGSVGCYLAHLKLWQVAAESREPIAIFEDDVSFNGSALDLIKDAEKHDYDILRLIYDTSYYPDREPGEQVSPLLRKTDRGISTAAYIMTPKAAKLAVQHAMPIEMHCDHYLDFIAHQYKLNQYYPIKPIHNGFRAASTIHHQPLVRKELCSNWIKLFASSLITLLLLIAILISSHRSNSGHTET